MIEALAAAGHFGRASDRLGIAQPHLSSALKALEAELGVQMFVRRPVVRLTPQGEIILQAAQRAFSDMEQAGEAARRVQAGAAGSVTVGFASSVMLTPIGRAIRAFQQDHPDVRLTLVDMHSNPQWEALASGRLDVGLTREIKPTSEASCTLLLQEPFQAALPSGHRLAEREGPIPVGELAGEPFVLFPEGVAPRLHADIVSLCVTAGFAPRVVQAADEWQTMLAFVSLGAGVTIGPACLSALRLEGVVFRDLSEARSTANTFLCHGPGALSATAETFVSDLRRRVGPA